MVLLHVSYPLIIGANQYPLHGQTDTLGVHESELSDTVIPLSFSSSHIVRGEMRSLGNIHSETPFVIYNLPSMARFKKHLSNIYRSTIPQEDPSFCRVPREGSYQCM